LTNVTTPVDRAGLRTRVGAALTAFLAAERAKLLAIDPALGDLCDTVDVLVLKGGKRLRPAFAYWGYRGAGVAERGLFGVRPAAG
jgi:geranylgeranyl diphosphate synthase type I